MIPYFYDNNSMHNCGLFEKQILSLEAKIFCHEGASNILMCTASIHA